jgi:3-methyl-2-oxobutanoate hydroxymethyltransferase
MPEHTPLNQRITLKTLREYKRKNEKFACLTAYDASFAHLLDNNGIDVLLVGDSLGMVVQGHDSTLPVTVDDMVYHCQAVSRGSQRALLMADMPFMGDASPARALDSAARLMKEGGAQIVKLEGGAVMVETIALLSSRGIPVCAHLGLLPQSINKLGAYQIQGRDDVGAQRILDDARLLEQAGADVLLLECVPAGLAAKVTRNATVPVIGIGAGNGCDGQVLVI